MRPSASGTEWPPAAIVRSTAVRARPSGGRGWLRPILPDRLVLLADVEVSELIVGHAPFDLTSDVPLPDDRPLDETVRVPTVEPELGDPAVAGVDEDDTAAVDALMYRHMPSPPIGEAMLPAVESVMFDSCPSPDRYRRTGSPGDR